VREKRADAVLIAVVAQASTPISDWTPGRRLHRRATDVIDRLERRGLRVTRILWVQGEADVILGTKGSAYADSLVSALAPLHRRTGAPVFVSRIGRCGDAESMAIRSAHAQVIAAQPWAYFGPDLDRVGPEQRFERCHFARKGQAHAVQLWLATLRGTVN
jgi:hypothetical protein